MRHQMMQCARNTATIAIPVPQRTTRNVNCIPMKTPMKIQYNTLLIEAPSAARGSRPLPSRELYSGAPRLSTSSPPLSLLLEGILPSAMSSADCTMAGSMPMLAIATTVSPFV